ncbi:Regulator of rDNA transcription protein 15 [Capsicum baccatum]|uniref:Regulator of rDNA transcription protein 15 n=1 Tax=Capsicum baccatum TaxID=33114 RepID=A0A2G2V1R1_CAPBA|nr:Regulator of rDNA transcription protein 15 [Capsicum baccatum]
MPLRHGALVPWRHGAMAPQCHGAIVPWRHDATVPWRQGALVPVYQAVLVPWYLCDTVPWCHGAAPPWCHGAKVPRCHGAMVPWCLGALVPWRHGAMVPRCLCAKLPWCHGSCVTRCHGAMAPCRLGPTAPRCLGAMAPWCLGAMAPRCLGALVQWCHSATVPWCHSAMAPRCHGALVPVYQAALVPWCLCDTVPWSHGAAPPWCHVAKVPRCHGALVPWCLGALVIETSKFGMPPCTDIVLGASLSTYAILRIAEILQLRCPFGGIFQGRMHEPPLETGDRVVGLDGEGKTNLSHDGLNPAHVPHWWVNNPTLGEFCFTMIGRADIEGSKSNVAMNAWLPQASYPCGNFSDTSSFEFRRSKGSLGHAFTVRIRTGNQNQTSFYPSVRHEISVLVELILVHLHYLLTDVPPQPNSPPDYVFRPDRPVERALGPKRGAVPQFRFTE